MEEDIESPARVKSDTKAERLRIPLGHEVHHHLVPQEYVSKVSYEEEKP
jgi:hypothetical protein